MGTRACLCFLLLATAAWLSPGETADRRCAKPIPPGPCKALLERYQYDAGSGSCTQFFWGGCGDPAPFETKAACEAACGGAKPLIISGVASLAHERLPYATVSVEYPKDWQEPQFTVLVNGVERPFRPWGGGFSPEKQFATLLVFPGEGEVVRITVRAASGGQTAEASEVLRWNVSSMAGLLDGPGRLEAVMVARSLRFWAFPTDGLRVRFNGRAVTPKLAPLSGKPVGLYSVEPEWQAGKNVLAIETTGRDGKSATREYSFVYLPEGTARVGESLAIPYGRPGGKSGPFYTFELEGNALVSVGQTEEPYAVIDPEGWAVEKEVLVRTLRAERPGESRVRIHVKRHFLQGSELERELRIRVVPGSGS